ncbi:hypothetical protein PFICI_09753 [Pestalotiopsis fici W106-1]|uniref:Uncharacterized protein n=1 Tax=Pestalotiopsis fici (strain W106-1 / CGMCC3.15140) TaxID=1229662 RepID=W3WXS9_PESFW|nr:uncharacterized protein PFICI_09753 [Pestalotiopsis fici W106-1]ETS77691.1 hypothetical protein PFICI_09753 [Pestalotiopsis fici W106-1]
MPPATRYQWLPGPVGDMLRPAMATTATVPLSGYLIITTGHVGVDLKTGQLVTSSVEAEFNAVFDCLDAALCNAGAPRGLQDAHKLVAYYIRAEDEKTLVDIFKKRYPGHSPTWTSVVVKALANEGVHVEVQAEAAIYT